MSEELLELAIVWREVSCRIFFRDRDLAKLLSTLAEDLMVEAMEDQDEALH